MALINRSSSTGAMRAVARQRDGYTHDIKLGSHRITADEPRDVGGADLGPSPQELLSAALASCTAVTMEMYAQRKGWNIEGLEVEARYSPAERGCPTRFELVMRMPSHLTEEQVERLQVIAAKCPVHRTLEGEVAFDERVEQLSALADRLDGVLLAPEEALAMQVHGGRKESAVLVPLFADASGAPHAVFTERRHDLRRHAGEISFPGGRRDPGEELIETALREANEEIGLEPGGVEIVGALAPVGTYVTNYAIYPFVGVIEAGLEWVLGETEVAQVLELSFASLVAGAGERRMVRRGMAFRTHTYEVGPHLIWGATARILADLLVRFPAAG